MCIDDFVGDNRIYRRLVSSIRAIVKFDDYENRNERIYFWLEKQYTEKRCNELR